MSDKETFDWYGVMSGLEAVDTVPEELENAAARRLGKAYLCAFRTGDDREKYWLLAETLFLRLADTAPSRYVYSVLAGLYRQAYGGSPGIGTKTKEELLHRALDCYERLYNDHPDEYELYEYAHLLYKSSSVFSAAAGVRERLERKEKAYRIYGEVMEAYKRNINKKTVERPYIRAAYGLCRCGLELYGYETPLQKEYVLLTGGYYLSERAKEVKKTVFYTLCRAVDSVRRYENIPTVMEDGCRYYDCDYRYEAPWDIYYMMGRLFLFAVKYNILPNRSEPVRSCEKYFTYAAVLDRKRRSEGLPVSGFSHMYHSLCDFYLMCGTEEKLGAFLKEYGDYMEPSYIELTNLRRALKGGNYEKARACLNAAAGRPSSLPPRKATVLKDLLTVLEKKDMSGVERSYKPYEMKLFAEVLQKKNRTVRTYSAV